jgi:hypothetical protein
VDAEEVKAFIRTLANSLLDECEYMSERDIYKKINELRELFK